MANQFRVSILITIFILINFCQGKKEWQQPKDVLPKVVKNDEDGLETILYDTPEGIWEFGNGQIWHQPKGEKAREVTKEYDPIKEEDIQKLIQKLKAKGQTNGNGSPSIRNFQFTSSDSIRNTRVKSDSIRTKPATPSSIRNKNLSFRPTDSIRAANGKKKWKTPDNGKASLVVGEDDIETVRFDCVAGIWEIGIGEIWHMPKGGQAREVTNEYDVIQQEKIRKLIQILKKEGPINDVNQSPAILEFNSTGGSIRTNAAAIGGGNAGPSSSGSIRTIPKGSIRTSFPKPGSIRTQSIRSKMAADKHIVAGKTVKQNPALLPPENVDNTIKPAFPTNEAESASVTSTVKKIENQISFLILKEPIQIIATHNEYICRKYVFKYLEVFFDRFKSPLSAEPEQLEMYIERMKRDCYCYLGDNRKYFANEIGYNYFSENKLAIYVHKLFKDLEKQKKMTERAKAMIAVASLFKLTAEILQSMRTINPWNFCTCDGCKKKDRPLCNKITADNIHTIEEIEGNAFKVAERVEGMIYADITALMNASNKKESDEE